MGFKTAIVDTSVEETTESKDEVKALTVAELKTMAKKKGITGCSNMTKQQLIDAIDTTL